jgi:hypothetical protein
VADRKPLIVEVDQRGRVSLNRAMGDKPLYKYYFIEVEPTGAIILTPAVVVPQSYVTERKEAT